MKQQARPIKISTLLNMIIAILFVVVAVIIVALVNYNMRQMALSEAEDKMGMILNRNLAIHSYYTQQLKPNLFQATDPILTDDDFDPSWMSSSYAVREIGLYFEDLSSEDFYYKDAVINARNPQNEADAEEASFLAEVNMDPSLQERSSVRIIDGDPYLVVMRPGEILVESCLQCHGDPQDAPGELVALYGAERSFNRQSELGSIVSALSVRVPLAAVYSQAKRVFLQVSAILVLLLGLLFCIQIWLKKRLVFAPLTRLRDQALLISTHEEHLGDQMVEPFGEELGAVTRAFNTMSARLRQNRDHLEKRIRERTIELENSAKELRSERDLAESLIETAQTIVLVLDTQGKIERFNQYMEDISGYKLEEVKGKDWFSLFIPERDRERTNQLFLRAIHDIQTRGNVSPILTKDGHEREIEWYDKTLKDGKGNVTGLLSSGQDITERKIADDALKFLSTHDALTGLYNRGYFEEEMARLERGRSFPVSIVMADVDYLKKTNDHKGHAAGDDLLIRVAEILASAFRVEDVVARIGGDEFAVLLPATDAKSAQISLDRIHQAILEYNIADPENSIRLSLGMSTAESHASLADVLKKADEDMYRRKNQNRD